MPPTIEETKMAEAIAKYIAEHRSSLTHYKGRFGELMTKDTMTVIMESKNPILEIIMKCNREPPQL